MRKIYLGIDIGGTKTRGVLFDFNSKRILSEFIILTPKNKADFLKILGIEISKIIGKKKISGIGIGLAGIVDASRGVLIKAPNITYLKNWQAKKFFSRFGRTKIDNDSRCFLRAEAVLGAAKKYKNAVALTIGTGIGGGIMIKGKIYRGSGSAGEFGHTIIDANKTLEQLAAKKAFLKFGDRSRIIGVGVANIINVLDPEIVILGGGGVINNKVKLPVVAKTARKFIISPLSRKTPIIKGKLGEFSQAIGAALLFL